MLKILELNVSRLNNKKQKNLEDYHSFLNIKV